MKPAPLTNDEWRWRWQCRADGDWENPTYDDLLLHRVAEPFQIGDWESTEARTVCGRTMMLCMPGFGSRIGAPRCPKCCEVVGIPAGDGAPYNDRSLSKEQRES